MRWLVFFLLVLNGLTFSWFIFQGDHHVNATKEAGREDFDFSTVTRLALLSELPEAEVSSRDLRNQIKPKVKAVPVSPDVVVEVDVTADGLAFDQSSGVSDIDGEIAYEQEIQEKRKNGFVDMDVNAYCALIGPFPEMVSAKQARGRLAKVGLDSTPVVVIKDLPPIHWVYIPPKPTRKMALATLKSLQAKNIDSFIISDGEYHNGISLGFFSSLLSAKETMEERRAQGYDVAITDRIRQQQSYWVAFDSKVSKRVDDNTINTLEVGNIDLKKQEKSCVDVALLEIIE